mmetsp:Transcript_31039/g.96572  ORF Transcript_31039/g.96572 Transcript_31039/m.96572 type:complete len:536 (-) Transcript_31039:49-1656(-)
MRRTEQASLRLQVQADALEATCAERESEMLEAQRAHRHSLRLSDDYTERLGFAQAANQRLQAELEHVRSEVASLSTAKHQLQMQLEAGETAWQGTERRLQAAQAHINELQVQGEVVQREFRQARLQADEVTELAEARQRMAGELSRCQNEASEARNLQQHDRFWALQLQQENERLTADLRAAGAFADSLQTELRGTGERVTDHHARCCDLWVALENERLAAQRLRETLQEAQRENLTLSQRLGQQPQVQQQTQKQNFQQPSQHQQVHSPGAALLSPVSGGSGAGNVHWPGPPLLPRGSASGGGGGVSPAQPLPPQALLPTRDAGFSRPTAITSGSAGGSSGNTSNPGSGGSTAFADRLAGRNSSAERISFGGGSTERLNFRGSTEKLSLGGASAPGGCGSSTERLSRSTPASGDGSAEAGDFGALPSQSHSQDAAESRRERQDGDSVSRIMRQGHYPQEQEARRERQVSALEKQLTLLSGERRLLESALMKFPSNTAGRTLAERRQKREAEQRLEEVDRTITELRQALRKVQEGG